MVRKIIETKIFSKDLGILLKKRNLNREDYDEFKRELSLNPNLGVIVVGTGGIRKARLKSASRGKSGGFRVCYYFLVDKDYLYLLCIFAKNVQENLTQEEKNSLKKLVSMLKEG